MLSELEAHMHGKVNIIQFSCSVILTHLQSAFPMESGKIFWDWSLGLLQFWSEGYFPDNSLSILKTSIRSMSFKMILSKHARAALFLNHVYFPLGTPLYHEFWCFSTSSSCSSQSSHIFCQPPRCLHDCRWWNFTALGFFCCLLVMTLSTASPPLFSSFQYLWKGPSFPTLLLLSQTTQHWSLFFSFLSDSSNSQLLSLHP